MLKSAGKQKLHRELSVNQHMQTLKRYTYYIRICYRYTCWPDILLYILQVGLIYYINGAAGMFDLLYIYMKLMDRWQYGEEGFNLAMILEQHTFVS